MLRLPTYVHYEITDKCNLRCLHCFHFDVDNMPKSINLDKNKTISTIKLLIDNGIYSLTITGGEPFTRPKVALDAVRVAKNAGLFVTINTNLLCITSEIIHELKKYQVNNLLVSCPAGDEEIYRKITRTGDYNVFKEKLKMLVNSKIPFLVNMVVSQINYGYMEKTAIEMAELGVKRFAMTPASLNVDCPDYNQLLTIQQIHKLFEILRWCKQRFNMDVDSVEALPKCFYPSWCFEDQYDFTRRVCIAGRKSVSISNVGEVRPCAHNPKSYGNIFNESLESIWDKMSDYRMNIIPEMCNSCPTLSNCKGACRIYSIAKYHVLNKPDRLAKGPITIPVKKKAVINIEDNTVFDFIGKLRYRSEKKNYYSVVSRENCSNLMIVNESMFEFIKWLFESLPLSFIQIKAHANNKSSSESVLTVLSSLIQNRFIDKR